jgi:hypothetical protein
LFVSVPEVKNLPGMFQFLIISSEDIVLLDLEVFLIATAPESMIGVLLDYLPLLSNEGGMVGSVVTHLLVAIMIIF